MQAFIRMNLVLIYQNHYPGSPDVVGSEDKKLLPSRGPLQMIAPYQVEPPATLHYHAEGLRCLQV
jgi:hypothetical protein